MKNFKKIIFGILFFCILITPLMANIANATDVNEDVLMNSLKKTAAIAGFETTDEVSTDLPTIIGNIIRLILKFLGIIAIIMLIMGGVQWMTSGGAEEKTTNARKLIVNSLIGLIIVLLAYVITVWVVNTFKDEIVKDSTTTTSATTTGLAAGAPCTSTSICANGLTCKQVGTTAAYTCQ